MTPSGHSSEEPRRTPKAVLIIVGREEKIKKGGMPIEGKKEEDTLMTISYSSTTGINAEERRKEMATKLHWDSEDQATPALLEPLIEEEMGLGCDDDLRPEAPEQKAEAAEATKAYLLNILKRWEQVSMGDWETYGYAFYDGYLAGLTHNTDPVIS